MHVGFGAFDWTVLSKGLCMPNMNIDVCKTQMPPFPNIWTISWTFDPDLWPTNLSIDRDLLLNKDYLLTKFEACGSKLSWVIRHTRCGRLAWLLTFDLLTWTSIGVIYSSRTIYLPRLKLVGQSVLELLSVAQGEVDYHDLWPWSSTHQGLSTYQVWSFWGTAFLSYQLHKVK